MQPLAIAGGKPVRERPFRRYNSIGEEEKRAVLQVMDTGVLSQFLGCWGDDFYGGPKVRELERLWAEKIGARHAITVNSATSGLNAAVGACGIGPGDEVIVTPTSMAATASAILVYNAVPVFADIEPDTFNLDPSAVEKLITPRTKAIMLSHIFGHPALMGPMMEVARRHNLRVIEDCAQSPFARCDGRYVGLIGDVGVFSLNYHKHIHTGEGGVVVTNDDHIAERVELIRNHGEAVVEEKGVTDIVNTLGWNYRLTEIQAAIGVEQVKKADGLIQARVERAACLSRQLRGIPGITLPVVREGCTHVYYLYVLRYSAEAMGVPRETFVRALQAEGVPWGAGYVKPLYMLPMYQRRIVYGKGCPFDCPAYEGKVSYQPGICPTAERMHSHELVTFEVCTWQLDEQDVNDVARAFHKVVENRSRLRELQ